jgi:hypothetical protein
MSRLALGERRSGRAMPSRFTGGGELTRRPAHQRSAGLRPKMFGRAQRCGSLTRTGDAYSKVVCRSLVHRKLHCSIAPSCSARLALDAADCKEHPVDHAAAALHALSREGHSYLNIPTILPNGAAAVYDGTSSNQAAVSTILSR